MGKTRVAPSIFRNGRGHLGRLVRKIAGVAKRQEALVSGTSCPLLRATDHLPKRLSRPTAGRRTDKKGFANSSCCRATPAILRMSQAT